MPMFYFHLRAPSGLERDDTGLDCADFEAAYLEAHDSIPELTADLIRRGQNPMRYTFEIEDESGRLLVEVPFVELVRDAQPRPPELRTERMRAATQVERAQHLAASVREQVEALRREMQASKDWLASARALPPW